MWLRMLDFIFRHMCTQYLNVALDACAGLPGSALYDPAVCVQESDTAEGYWAPTVFHSSSMTAGSTVFTVAAWPR